MATNNSRGTGDGAPLRIALSSVNTLMVAAKDLERLLLPLLDRDDALSLVDKQHALLLPKCLQDALAPKNKLYGDLMVWPL